MANWSGSTHTTPDRSSILKRLIVKIRDANIYSLNMKRNDSLATKDILLVSASAYI